MLAMDIKDLDKLDVYIMGDQPTTCPHCGRRTIDFIEVDDHTQQHECKPCNYTFLVQWEEEEDVIKECIEDGLHLTDCDDDGYCNYCGYQDSGEYDEDE